ncbi:MAG: ABC transporter permease [Clostridiales bacterium]|jgi:putative ABC transport system permease protein|nr:ABC transporter permease [Clostridiales bacterium]
MIYTILQLGLIYSLLALGVYITYSLLNFPDLGVDGSITLGGGVAIVAILSGVDPYIATLLAVICGALAGVLTGLLHVKFRINNLISGIITTTALYSINLVVMGGKPNLSLSGKNTIFSLFINNMPRAIGFIVLILLIVVITKVILNVIFNSKLGIFTRSVGSNPALVSTMGGNVGLLKIIGLALSNALVAFCGAVLVQYQGYCDIGMSTGALVLGLTMVILGISLQRVFKKLEVSFCVMIGAIVYQAIIGTALTLGLPTIYMKLSTAVILVIVLTLRKERVA